MRDGSKKCSGNPTLNASRISSSESVSFIFLAIIVKNSAATVSSWFPVLDPSWLHTGEVDGSVVVGVDLVDHVLKLRLRRVLAEGAHDSAELLRRDLTWSSY